MGLFRLVPANLLAQVWVDPDWWIKAWKADRIVVPRVVDCEPLGTKAEPFPFKGNGPLIGVTTVSL